MSSRRTGGLPSWSPFEPPGGAAPGIGPCTARGNPWSPLPPRDTRRPESAAASGLADADRDDRLQRLEAVLFLAREPLNSRKLSQYANLADGTEARTLIRRLNRLYDESGRAFRVEETAGGFRLMTRAKFASWLRRLAHVPPEVRLSAPALETLAVVAYRQPVLKAVIEAIRGVNCGEVLRQLMERDLVRIVGRSEELGRPYLYGPTRKFLQVFGLRSLDDLPRVEILRGSGRTPDSPEGVPMEPMLVNEGNDQDPQLLAQPQKENVAVTVRTPARPAPRQNQEISPDQEFEMLHAAAPAGAAGVFAAKDDDEDEFEEEELDDEDDDYEDDEFEDEEEFEEDEEWELEDEESAEESEEDFEDEEWEEVEDDDEEFDEEDDEEEEWGDDDDDWEDD